MATFSYLLIYFVPQFTEATDYRYNNPRKCDISNEILRIYCVYIKNSLLRVAITYFVIVIVIVNSTIYIGPSVASYF